MLDAGLHQRRGFRHRRPRAAERDVHPERELHQSQHCEGDFAYLPRKTEVDVEQIS